MSFHKNSQEPGFASRHGRSALRIIGLTIGGVVFAVFFAFLFGLVVKVLWNWLMPALFGLGAITFWQAFGIVLLEAWQHRKPVIGARAGGIPDVIKHEQNGLLVPFGDAKALAAAIRRLLEEPDWAATLGESGYDRLGQYAWDRTYATLLEAYRLALTVGS